MNKNNRGLRYLEDLHINLILLAMKPLLNQSNKNNLEKVKFGKGKDVGKEKENAVQVIVQNRHLRKEEERRNERKEEEKVAYPVMRMRKMGKMMNPSLKVRQNIKEEGEGNKLLKAVENYPNLKLKKALKEKRKE